MDTNGSTTMSKSKNLHGALDNRSVREQYHEAFTRTMEEAEAEWCRWLKEREKERERSKERAEEK